MNADFKKEIFRKIDNKIRSVRDISPDIYKAYPHRFTLNPILSENEIQVFESRVGVVLPEDYRSYLKEIGNGGTHGILPLRDVMRRRYSNDKVSPKYVANHFLLEESITEDHLRRVGYFNYSEAGKEDYWLNSLRGSIDIKNVACGEFDILIVSGNRVGEIWNDMMYADIGIYRTDNTFWSLID